MTDMNKAKTQLLEHDYTCVICKVDKIYTSTFRGVKPLVNWLDEKIDVQGFSAADKVIGKATAFLYVLLGVKEVYAHVISESALEVLRSSGIAVEAGVVVKYIINRRGDGMCPFEDAVLSTETPQDAYDIIKNKMKEFNIS